MEQSLKQALSIYPALKRYTFCLPFQLTGPGAGGRGKKNQIETLESWIAEWKKIPRVRKSKTKIDWWDLTELSSRLHAADPSGGRTIYWFNKTVLTTDWFKKHLDAAKRQAGARYSPQLRVDVPVFDAFAAFEGSEDWFKQTKALRDQLSAALKTLARSRRRPQQGPVNFKTGSGDKTDRSPVWSVRGFGSGEARCRFGVGRNGSRSRNGSATCSGRTGNRC